ncbi:MAG: hypothetical protein QXS54_12425 [Candidatus Methanomethylicaceae archaeon]
MSSRAFAAERGQTSRPQLVTADNLTFPALVPVILGILSDFSVAEDPVMKGLAPQRCQLHARVKLLVSLIASRLVPQHCLLHAYMPINLRPTPFRRRRREFISLRVQHADGVHRPERASDLHPAGYHVRHSGCGHDGNSH